MSPQVSQFRVFFCSRKSCRTVNGKVRRKRNARTTMPNGKRRVRAHTGRPTPHLDQESPVVYLNVPLPAKLPFPFNTGAREKQARRNRQACLFLNYRQVKSDISSAKPAIGTLGVPRHPKYAGEKRLEECETHQGSGSQSTRYCNTETGSGKRVHRSRKLAVLCNVRQHGATRRRFDKQPSGLTAGNPIDLPCLHNAHSESSWNQSRSKTSPTAKHANR